MVLQPQLPRAQLICKGVSLGPEDGPGWQRSDPVPGAGGEVFPWQAFVQGLTKPNFEVVLAVSSRVFARSISSISF